MTMSMVVKSTRLIDRNQNVRKCQSYSSKLLHLERGDCYYDLVSFKDITLTTYYLGRVTLLIKHPWKHSFLLFFHRPGAVRI